MHRIKSCVKTGGFGNGLVWMTKTETLDASILGDSGAEHQCGRRRPNGKILNSCLLNLACFPRLKCRASLSRMSNK